VLSEQDNKMTAYNTKKTASTVVHTIYFIID